MLDTYTIRQADMPAELQFLLETYPRDSWNAHPGFKDKTRHWLGAHQMFRRIAAHISTQSEALLNKDIAADAFAGELSYYGGALVQNLHGHHGWEDHTYFPELSAADPRFDAGLELLEKDHADLDVVLDAFTDQANRVIKLATLDESQMHDETAAVYKTSQTISAFLDRHLTDEEDLAVPIILHHRLRG